MKQLLLLGLALVSFSLAAQSPWPRSKAGFFVQAAWQTIPTYDAVFESLNDLTIQPDREITENTFQLYGEYGLTRRNTVFASLPIRSLKSGDFIPQHFEMPETAEGHIRGLGNASLGLRSAILTGKLRLTGTLRFDLPTNRYDEATGLRTGYNTWSIQPMLSTGMGLGRWYWFTHAGYGFRTRGYSDVINTGGEIGLKTWKFWLVGFTELVYSMENGSVSLPIRNRIKNSFVDRQGWWSLGAKTIFEANAHWGLTASFAGAGWAQFVPKSPGISLGVYFKQK